MPHQCRGSDCFCSIGVWGGPGRFLAPGTIALGPGVRLPDNYCRAYSGPFAPNPRSARRAQARDMIRRARLSNTVFFRLNSIRLSVVLNGIHQASERKRNNMVWRHSPRSLDFEASAERGCPSPAFCPLLIRRRAFFFVLGFLLAVTGCAKIPPAPSAHTSAADDLQGQVRFLSSPKLGGRKPGTHGSRLARQF